MTNFGFSDWMAGIALSLVWAGMCSLVSIAIVMCFIG